MKIIVRLEEFIKQLKATDTLFLRVTFSENDGVTYKCVSYKRIDDSIELLTNFNIRIELSYLKAELLFFDGGTENASLVQIIKQEDRQDSSRLTVIDASIAEPVEPTVENALIVLRQQATIERRANAQTKV